MLLTKSLIPLLIINVVLYVLLKKYFGFVRSSLYWLIVVLSVIMGHILDMLAFTEAEYTTPFIVAVFFALFVAMCIYEYLFDK